MEKKSISQLADMFREHYQKNKAMRKFEFIKNEDIVQFITAAREALEQLNNAPKIAINPFIDVRYQLKTIIIELERELDLRETPANQ